MPESIHVAPDRIVQPRRHAFRPSAATPALLPTLGFSVPEILNLQRMLGNQGVGRHVASRAPGDPSVRTIQRCSACAKSSAPLPESEQPIRRDLFDDATAAVGDAGSSLLNAAGDALQGVVDTGTGLAQGAVASAGNLLGGDGGGGAGPTGGGGGGGSSSSGGGSALPTLRLGAAGDAVTSLQEKLGALGFSSPISGMFDDATAAAVEAFQSAAGLIADGVVGLLTWAGLGKADGGGGGGPNASANVAPKSPFRRDGQGGKENFCKPFTDPADISANKIEMGAILAATVTPLFGSAVANLWSQYLNGGTGLQTIQDPGIIEAFADSSVSRDATREVADAIVPAIDRDPKIPDGTFPIKDLVNDATRATIGDQMNFSNPFSTPGHIAGGIGKDQTSAAIGARPSPVNDSRVIGGVAQITTMPNGSRGIFARPTIIVTDTIDFCPGDSGSAFEETLTVPLSRLEASGAAGDVPFQVTYKTQEVFRFSGKATPPDDVDPPGGP